MRLLRKPSHSLAMSAFGVSCVRGERDIVTIVANTIPASTISKFPCYLVGPSTCLHDTLDLTCCLLSLTAHRRYEPEGPEPAWQLQATVSSPPPAIVAPQLNTTMLHHSGVFIRKSEVSVISGISGISDLIKTDRR